LRCTLFFLFEGIFIWITDRELSDKENIQSISDKMKIKLTPENLSLMSATNQYLFRNCFSYDQKSQIKILRFLEIFENNKSEVKWIKAHQKSFYSIKINFFNNQMVKRMFKLKLELFLNN